ncbi:MAG: hypothetical protein M4579_004824 [Chaenotheca gracillima]|nr:MAG: hypothetical protein M4579_004824 [Chaenotheca gracillima]
MASAPDITAGAQSLPPEGSGEAPPAERRRGGGRRGGGRREGGANNLSTENPRGGRRGANTGRGSRSGPTAGRAGRTQGDASGDNAAGPGPPRAGGRGAFGSNLTKGAAETKGEGEEIAASPHAAGASKPAVEEDDTEAEASSEFIIFTDDPLKRFEEFKEADFARSDNHLGIKYERQEIVEDTVLLLRFNCPDSSCDIACLSWPDLHRHVKSMHQKVMCDLCTRNKKVFTHEHELFTASELRKHDKFGDDNPGAVDQSGFKGHPECGFCRQRFYGDDELYTHCRDRHERCHICDRSNQGRQQQYYQDYNALEIHFRKDHFLCPDNECLEKKFVVFDSEIDLKGHQLESHPDGLSKDARREARRIDISGFEYRTQHQQERDRGGRREGRGRGRGRDPNTEPLPSSTAQPMRRDELAYQRQMAIQSAQSVSTRTFGGQLTAGDAYAARPPPTETATVTASRPAHQNAPDNEIPQIDSLSVSETTTTPQQQARALHHAAVTSRASKLLQNSTEKINSFRSLVSSYRTSTISASSLIESLIDLLRSTSAPSADIGKLIRELAEIYEDNSKRNDLLKAWNDWRAVNEDYPALPPGATGSGSGLLGSGGARVLKLKRATAPSSRSEMGRHGSWGSTGDPADPFPSIGGSNTGTNNSNSRGPKPSHHAATPWVSHATQSSSSAPSSRPSSRPPTSSTLAQRTSTRSGASTPVGRGNGPVGDAFPALPAAAKPTSTIFGYGTGAVRRNGGSGNGSSSNLANPWGGANSTGSGLKASTDDDVVSAPGTAGAGGKKKASKKQMLFHFG